MKIERLEHSRVKAIFDVTAEEFEKALDQAFETENAKVTIKGFRAGKAPRKAFENKFGVESLYDEALNVVLNSKAQEIYENKELASEIVGRFEPAFEGDSKFERGKEFQVSLTFDVYPTFNLPQYKGVKVTKAVLEATDDEVDNAVKSLARKDASKAVKEEQVIAEGDYAVFDFVGSVDGVEFPGGKAENYELQIGSGQFIPGFEDQMIGMKADETKDVVVTFPENYSEASLAGKEAVFKVTVHEVKVETFPELTDEYVAGLNIEGVTTLAELKASKKAELEANKKVSEKDRQVDSIINNILDNAVVDMPASLEEEKIAAIRGQYEQQAKMYNIPFETFLSLMGMEKAKFEEQIVAQGKRQALFNVVISKIIEEEKLTPTKEELEAEAAKEAAATNKDANKLLQEKFAQYYSTVAYEKVINLLLENAEII